MQWIRGSGRDNWARFGLAARVFKALANASVFLFLLLPLVAISSCGTTVAKFTGYEVLQETAVPSPYTEPLVTITYGPDWWVLGVMIFAAAGLGSAWRGGAGSMTRAPPTVVPARSTTRSPHAATTGASSRSCAKRPARTTRASIVAVP